MSWLFRDPVVIMKEIMPWLFKDPISSGLPIQSYDDVSFSGPKYPIYPRQSFFGTSHYYYFHLSIGPFHCAKFKKILTADPELWGCATFGLKNPIYMPKIKSKSDINLLVKYWRLKSIKISMAESHFWL